MRFSGSYVALVTPFHADGSVNFEKLRELVEWHVQQGTDGIVALGTTGESSTMSHEEDDAVARAVIETVNGRIPVICGAGSNSTQTQLEKSRRYHDMGADGLLLITPYYNKANDEGMYRHFAAVADAVDTPIILYNVPGGRAARFLRHAVRGWRRIRTSRVSRKRAATSAIQRRLQSWSATISACSPATTI